MHLICNVFNRGKRAGWHKFRLCSATLKLTVKAQLGTNTFQIHFDIYEIQVINEVKEWEAFPKTYARVPTCHVQS